MAHLIRPLRKTFLYPPLSPQHNPISRLLHNNKIEEEITSQTHKTITRDYISEMRKAACKDNLLRRLRNEIQYELDHSAPEQPVTKYESFTVDDQPGEQWVRLKRKFRQNEEIKVEATMLDGSALIPKSGVPGIKEDEKLQITLIVSISKSDGEVLETLCSAWPDSLQITNLFVHRSTKPPPKAYVGPEFKELDDELQDALHEFLEARGINDDLAVFLHEYMRNKGKTEYTRWLGTVKSYIESK